MGKVALLDCTLRDGGYLNDWQFGHDNIVSIFERVVDAGTDIIEVGFLDERRPFDMDRSIMPDTDAVGAVYGALDKRGTLIFGMIDYGACGLENIRPKDESYLDGIRVIFKKHLRREALGYVSELKKLGYRVFAQLVSVTAYSEDELRELCLLANQAGPDAVSMVDTYGLLHQGELRRMLAILDEGLAPGIAIGYHGHNNFQMAYANCITVLDYAAHTKRELLVDGSLYGMGKSAGNAPIELVAMHMNHACGKKYGIGQYLEAIDANIMQFYQPATWGYNLFYYLAASNDCHPSYVKQLTNKRTLSVRQTNELLGKLEGEKKLLYDKDYMEKLYVDYLRREVDDSEALASLGRLLAGKKILAVGPGTSMVTHAGAVAAYIQKERPFVVSVNYVPGGLAPDLVFLSNAKRYIQVATALSRLHTPVLATSNVTSTGEAFAYVLNVSSLLDASSRFPDNSLRMLLLTLVKAGVGAVSLAGFDGYSGEEHNYFDEGKEYDFARRQAQYLNDYMTGFLKEIQGKLDVSFLTPTHYLQEENHG